MVFHLIQQNLQLPVSVWKIVPIITTKTLSKEYTCTCVYKNKNEVWTTCQKVHKQGREDIKAKANIQSLIVPASFHKRV